MRRSFNRPIAWAIALAGVMVFGIGFSSAAESPLAGTWKATVHFPPRSVSLWLIQIEDKDGKSAAKVLASSDAQLQDPKVKSIKADEKSVHLDVQATVQGRGIDFALVAYFPKDGAKTKSLLGSVFFNNQRLFAELEKTDLKELDPKKAGVPSSGLADVQKAAQIKDPKERDAALKQFLEKNSEGALPYAVRLNMILSGVKEGTAEMELRGHADKLVELARPYGPEMKMHTLQSVTQILSSSDKLSALTLNYAQQAEKALDKSAAVAQQASVLKALASALKKNGKAGEAKELKGRIATLDAKLDEEFVQNAVPFKPEPTTARKSKSDRIVLVELFTGAQCPPCVSADIAFDAMVQAYKPIDIALLQYHLHIPRPDPLTNADTETRSDFYEARSTPTVLVDGKEIPAMGGFKQDGKDRYETLQKAVSAQLDAMPLARLKVSADKAAGKINIHTEVSELKNPGESKRLHVVVVEEVVRYAGSNGQRLHHHVVRAFPGGAKGIQLKEASAKQNVTVNLADLRKSLNEYLSQAPLKFDEDSRPLDLKHLKVVAFVQDEKTKEVLQATQADIGEDKSETE